MLWQNTWQKQIKKGRIEQGSQSSCLGRRGYRSALWLKQWEPAVTGYPLLGRLLRQEVGLYLISPVLAALCLPATYQPPQRETTKKIQTVQTTEPMGTFPIQTIKPKTLLRRWKGDLGLYGQRRINLYVEPFNGIETLKPTLPPPPGFLTALRYAAPATSCKKCKWPC